MDKRILIRIALAVAVIGFIVLFTRVAMIGFSRGAHDTSQLNRAELEASGGAQKRRAPDSPEPESKGVSSSGSKP